jgi:hypothetical protein
MKAYGEMDVWIHTFFTSALAGGDGQVHVPAVLPPVSIGEEFG